MHPLEDAKKGLQNEVVPSSNTQEVSDSVSQSQNETENSLISTSQISPILSEDVPKVEND